MFEVGDKVVVKGYSEPVIGKIVSWYFDEGNVWMVELSDGRMEDFGDHDLAPATDAYGHSYST